MRRVLIYIIFGIVFGSAALLSACGAAQVQEGANQAATAASGPEAASAINAAATALSGPEVASAMSEAATALSGPEAASAMSMAATAISDAAGALSAAEEDVTVRQGEQLVLDATGSTGDIKDYKWTIVQAPAGAESVVGQTIKEGSSGNVSLNPDDYAKYFPKSGTYTVRLTVTSGSGATSSDDFTIDVP